MAHASVLDGWTLASATTEERLPSDDLARIALRVAQGDLDGLGPLYDALAPELFAVGLWRTGSRSDAADVVQDVFVKLAAAPRTLAGVRHPRRYLLAMAHRSAIDRVRSRKDETPIDDAPLVHPADAESSADAARVTAALRALPDAQREAIYLHHYAGATFREAGRITGVPTFTAASRYRLGLARLRALLGGSR